MQLAHIAAYESRLPLVSATGTMEAIRLRGGRQGATAPPALPANRLCPLEPQFDVIALRNVRRGWLWYAETTLQGSFVSAQPSHESVRRSCGKHHVQGSGGQLPSQRGARGAAPARMREQSPAPDSEASREADILCYNPQRASG
jgi:hypothetical protein